MTTEERWRRDIRKWRPKAVRGDGTATSSIAVAYRVLGRSGLSARWFQKAAMAGDGDAMVDYAYCLQHGAGVRRDLTLAKEMYRRAIQSDHICENGREEALYLLSVILLRDESDASRREALKLLKASNVDGDYPVAQRLWRISSPGWKGLRAPVVAICVSVWPASTALCIAGVAVNRPVWRSSGNHPVPTPKPNHRPMEPVVDREASGTVISDRMETS